MTRRIVLTVASSALILGAGAVLILATGLGTIPAIAADTTQHLPNDSTAHTVQPLPPGDDAGSCEDARAGENTFEELRRRRWQYKCCSCVYVCDDGSRVVAPAYDPRGFPVFPPCQGVPHCERWICPPTWNDPDKGVCERSENSKRARCKWSPNCVSFPFPE